MRRRLLAALLLLAPGLLPQLAQAQGTSQPAPAASPPLVFFAAASLTDALRDIAPLWQAQGHAAPSYSFASSSTLARQIEQGAPANLFASADEQWADYLAQRNLLAADTRRDLLGNALVIVAPTDRPQPVAIGPDLALRLGADGRIATGDPSNVPAGIYAKQALTRLGLWDQLGPRIAGTADVRSALLLVERGEAPLGIVYATDAAVSKNVTIVATFPDSSHDPITYPFAVTKAGDTPEARAFLAFLSGPDARAVFAKRGFSAK